MKKLLPLLVISPFLATVALAGNGPNTMPNKGPGNNSQASERMPMHAKGGGMMMNMMDHEQMNAMHEQMQTMRTTMNQIQQEKDPKKRQQLMQEHLNQMQKAMQMMHMDAGNAEGPGMMTTEQMQEMMNQRMGMMHDNMGMMDMMMEQMHQHDAQMKRDDMPMKKE
ncbi:hypothetical protein [Halioxenophilus sp. WMMB6]|uniref:hypothetical protein n=1 Tax=Halioxenophilus sp. WMMB6 TaxID=3073815 RepID=UPI00295ED1FB|nr:hypothetical protein [Halioxenophilus sp. WMMB6]